MPSPNAISPQQLSRLIGTAECPTILDIRIDEDFADDPRLIPTAKHFHYTQSEEISQKYRGEKLVIYCQKGLKISQGMAALLNNNGLNAEYLEGGHFAWRDANLPMISSHEHNTAIWVTRHRPKIDRIACPWLIRRFIEPNAKFLFVEPSQVLNVAERFNATPFDIDGVTFSHHGETCSFDAILREFSLKAEPLEAMAKIIRAADTNRHALAPEAAGLLAFSVGLSRIYRNDLEQSEAGMAFYDALYRWARDGQDESHEWPHHSPKEKTK